MSSAATPFYAVIDEDQVQGWVAQDKRSYRAWGTFRSKLIITHGCTSSQAVDRWREAARYAANE